MKLTIIIAIILGLLRILIGFTVEPEGFAWIQVFKDIAHLFMGGLCVATVANSHILVYECFGSCSSFVI